MKKAEELQSIDPKIDFPKLEENILDFWKIKQIFQKSLQKNKNKKSFVFLEGPPTANGKPGIHHAIARSYKDVYLRYKTMQGFYVDRKAGWDTHGLPVEIQVEKELKISGKPQIETLKKTKKASIAYFNEKCQKSVWQHKADWENFTERIGYWVDMTYPYITYENTYIESLWWIIRQVWDRGLFYQGYKVVLHCPRCGTSLSSHEVAQGYKDIDETSIYVQFKVKSQKNTYILAWTTTPWTLPGNVALAIDENIDYTKIELVKSKNKIILAKARLNIIDEKYHILETFRGKKILGLEYEPLFNVKFGKKSHFVCNADFVTVDDGTGVVHTAVMYGEDDYNLGKKIGLPEKHTVDESGSFTQDVREFAGKFVHDSNMDIVRDLEKRGLAYKTENTRHSYPFCWRCDTKLIYYAKSTWYIAMSKVQKELLSENKNINWVPEHLRDGRFGEWLRDVKDWAFARERYWGTPLPIWKCSKCDSFKCIGSVEEISKNSINKPTNIILVRHGHSEHNDEQIYSDKTSDTYKLTPKGQKQIQETAKKLKNRKIDMIFSSDLLRCKQSSKIFNKILKAKINYDKRLGEIKFGKLYGKKVPSANFSRTNYYSDPFPGGESIADVQARIQVLLDELKDKYKGKTILLVSHENTLHAIMVACMKLGKDFVHTKDIPTASISEMNIPEVKNLHKPYIDDVKLKCEKCKAQMNRIEEVCDVWFDSGSAPFAQWHYPFENKEKIDKNLDYPADYISEAIDQTRGWFYTLLAVSTILKKPAPYKNVISLGHIRDKDGKKMSKSKGNMVQLDDIASKYGIDALRWYFFTVNQPGEYKNYDELDIQKNLKKNILILWNIYGFLVTYSQSGNLELKYQISPKPKHILDRWLYSTFNTLLLDITKKLDKYDVVGAARAVSEFINIFSTWYLRRSRKRLTKNTTESAEAMNYFYSVLIDLCKTISVFAPFATESIYQNLHDKDMPESIHLCDFPQSKKDLINAKLQNEIDYAREVSSLGQSIRANNKIKIRQPLSSIYVQSLKKLDISTETKSMIIDEVNVSNLKITTIAKNIPSVKSQRISGLIVGLDINITGELKNRGILAEIIRNIQSLRKTAECKPSDKVDIVFSTSNLELQKLIIKNKLEIANKNNLKTIKSVKSISQINNNQTISMIFKNQQIEFGLIK
ncbi:class I tRNA ligase family protein [Patescibacteria group bacterium]